MSVDKITNNNLNINDININDKTVVKIHRDLKVLLSGCKHVLDGHHIGTMFKTRYPHHEAFINSIVNGKIYENTMSIAHIRETIIDISLLKYKEDVIDLMDNICNGRLINDIQKRTFLRLGRVKIMKPFVQSEKNNSGEIIELVKKNCPHCGNLCCAQHNSEYIICGYSDSQKGYDYHGCGRDWCFKCGKILCKSWNHDTLFLELNRYHNSGCCEEHADTHNKKYPEDYCQCINQHVNRNGILFDLDFLLKK